MRKQTGGLRIAVSSAAQTKDFHIPWGDAVISALMMTGLSLLLTEAFPSVSYPWWIFSAASLLLGLVLMTLYSIRGGKWILPAGMVLVLALCLLFREQVTAGFGSLGNDMLKLLTEKTGRIYLDFAAGNSNMVLWAVVPLLTACILLVSRSVWRGQLWLSLLVLLPVYAAVLAGLLPCGAACGLLVMGTVLMLMQHTGKSRNAVSPFKGVLSHLFLPILCAALCLLLSMAAQERMDTDVRQTIQERLHEWLYDNDTNSMPEGDLKNLSGWSKSDTPALELTMEKPGKVYLRGQIYEVYTGTSWEQVPAGERAEYKDLFYWLHESGFYGQSQIGLASEYTTPITPLTMTVKNLSACSGHGYYPYAMYGNGLLDAALIGDTGLPEGETISYLSGSVPDWYEVQRNLSSAQGRENIESYLALEQAYAGYVDQFDLQMTQESWSVLERQHGQAKTAYSIAEIRNMIYAYLEENLSYDESVRTMNGNGDFLQYTLEKSGRGYSVHYATAAVLMLRYLGVPARYVEGYFLSADEADRYMAGETITLTEENAHAWAEYYVNGVGFVPFEVTPGYIDDEELDFGGSTGNAENTYEHNPQKFAQVQQPEKLEEREQERFHFSLNPKILLLLLLVPVLILAAIVILRRVRLKKALKAIDEADIRDGITMRYGYAVHLLNHSTAQPPEGAEEAVELNREALFSDHVMTVQQRKTVDDYADRVLSSCKESWTWRQKIWYRLWDCLY